MAPTLTVPSDTDTDDVAGDWESAKIAVKTWNCPVVCAAARMPVRLLPQK